MQEGLLMDFPVVSAGRTVGNCSVKEDNLYWELDCVCSCQNKKIDRLYCGSRNLGVLLPENDQLVLHRRISKSSVPEIPPITGVFSLEPIQGSIPWNGELAGIDCRGILLGDELLFPYEKTMPCPCEPLFCFFAIRDGFWRIPAEIVKTAD